jgi:hypothetical protein
MKLIEIIGPKEQEDLPFFIAVPQGTLWQKDIKNCWVFLTMAAAQEAAHSDRAHELLEGDYLPIYVAGNGLIIMLQLSPSVWRALPSNFQIFAGGFSHEACVSAGAQYLKQKGIGAMMWCYKTWNSNPDYFTQE